MSIANSIKDLAVANSSDTIAIYALRIQNREDEIARLQAELDKVTARCERAAERASRLESELADKEAVIKHYVTLHARDRESTPSSDNGHYRGRRQKLSGPDKFANGAAPAIQYESWLAQVQRKLRIDAELFDTEERKIAYVREKLTGAPGETVEEGLTHDEYRTVEDVFDALTLLYKRPNPKPTAEVALCSLVQAGSSFHDF